MESYPENPLVEQAKDLKLLPKNSAGRHDQIFTWLDRWCNMCESDREMLAMLNDKLDDLQTTGTGMSYNTRKSYHDSMVMKWSLQNAVRKSKEPKQKSGFITPEQAKIGTNW